MRITFLLLFLSILAHAQNQDEIQLANEYLLKGDKKKALDMYAELSKQDVNHPYIYNNYFTLLLDNGAYEDAQKFLQRLSKKDPLNMQYRLDLGLINVRSGELGKADRYYKDLISENKGNVQRIKMMSDYFMARSLVDYGIQALSESRQSLGNPYLFCLELAMLHRIKGNQDKMVQEYLSYVTQSSANIQYVKNVMQALLTKPEELESLEKLLYQRSRLTLTWKSIPTF